MAGFKEDLAKVRTGRVHPGIFDHVLVDCYGQKMPIPQLASVSAAGPRTLVVAPWDASNVDSIAVAVRESGLGLMPTAEVNQIRITVPELSEERRKELVKVVNRMGETARVAVRNIRRDLMQGYKESQKAGEMSQDEQKQAGAELQKLTDLHVAEISALAEKKAGELMVI